LARSNTFKSMLMRENRSVNERLSLAAWFSVVFSASVAARILNPSSYQPADLGLEGSLLAGILGGYVTGLVSGAVIAIPAAFFKDEMITLPLLAGIGVMGGLLRDLAPQPEEIWRFSPLPDLNIY